MDKQFNSILTAIALICVLFLGVGLLGVGMLKLIAFPEFKLLFENWSLPIWTMYLIGFIEILLAVLLLYKPYRFFTSIAIIVLMLGATCIHVLKQQYSFLYGPIIVMLFAITLVVISYLQSNKDLND